MAHFRIGHASDLHFSRFIGYINENELEKNSSLLVRSKALWRSIKSPIGSKGISYPSTFNRDVAIEFINTLHSDFSNNLDALFVTGDLSTTGEDEDMLIARNYFSGVIPDDWGALQSPIASLTDFLPYPIICIPGNHDRYLNISSQPISNSFEKHFGSLWNFDKYDTYEIPGKLFNNSPPRVRFFSIEKEDDFGEANALIFGLADFSLQSSSDGEGVFGWLGQGRAYIEVINELVRCTKIARKNAEHSKVKSLAVWIIHYPPKFNDINDSLKLIDDLSIESKAIECGVRLILTGHTHEKSSYSLLPDNWNHHKKNGQIPPTIFCCASTTGVPNDEYGFSYIDIWTNAGDLKSIKRTDLKYDFDDAVRTFIIADD